MSLEEDNHDHSEVYNNLDTNYSGQSWYDKAVRPIIHGTYHAGRYVKSGNPEKLFRSMDQFACFGSEQSQTEYYKAHHDAQMKLMSYILNKKPFQIYGTVYLSMTLSH